jgi:hypothetical protein
MRIAAIAAAVSTTSSLCLVSGCGPSWLGWLGFETGVGRELGVGCGFIAGVSSGASTKAADLAVLGADAGLGS